MCTPAQCAPSPDSVLAALARLSAAEDFFRALDLPFEPAVLHVNRLHILKRFHDLLDIPALEALDADGQRAACRIALARAYQEFANGGGDKTFQVFQRTRMGFVPVTAVTLRP